MVVRRRECEGIARRKYDVFGIDGLTVRIRPTALERDPQAALEHVHEVHVDRQTVELPTTSAAWFQLAEQHLNSTLVGRSEPVRRHKIGRASCRERVCQFV